MEQTKQIKQREQVQVTKINDSTYRFTENAFGADVYMYLLLGKEKALLIDTGYGFTDIPSAIKEITDLPLTIVNTHGHLDHIHGNHMYEKVYLSKKDEEVFRRHTDYQEVKELMLSIARSNHIPEEAVFDPAMNLEGISTAYPSVHVPLPEEMYFELGERRVTVIETPGHTAGSVCILDEKYKWIFVGDTACIDGVLLQFPESTDVQTFGESIARLQSLAKADAFTLMYPGHQMTPVDVSLLDTYQKGCQKILSENTDEIRASGVFSIDGRTQITFNPKKIRKDSAKLHDIYYADQISFKKRKLTMKFTPETPVVAVDMEDIVRKPYEVTAEGSVTFRLYFPEAKTVVVKVGSVSYPLSLKGDYWGGTYCLGNGFIPVQILVDGNSVLSKMLPLGFACNEAVNYIEVPEEDFSIIPSDAAHGIVAANYLKSEVTGCLERIMVYLPPQYQEQQERRFPVLYLQHGHGENEMVWVNQGKMNFLMDDLISTGEAEPCIIVMANGMITRETKEGVVLAYKDMEGFLTQEIIPYIDCHYRTLPGRNYRGMAGLSMGSIQTSYITMRNQELFSYVGLFSGFFTDPLAEEQPHQTDENYRSFSKNMKLFFRAMGDEDFWLPNFLEDDKLLEQKKIPCVRKIYSGNHEWKVWRRCFVDFMKLVFKENLR